MINGTWRRKAAQAAGQLGLAAAFTLGTASLPTSSLGAPHSERKEAAAPYIRCMPDIVPNTIYRAVPKDAVKLHAKEYFRTHATDQDALLMAWIALESGFEPYVVSDAAAVGLGQLRNDAARAQGLRVASNEELSCLISAYGGTAPEESEDIVAYRASLLRSARDLATKGIMPESVLMAADQRFDYQKNLEASLEHLTQFDTSLPRRFLIYHSGETRVRRGDIGPQGRSYFPRIVAMSHEYAD